MYVTKNMLKDCIMGNFAVPEAIDHVNDIVT